MTPRTLLAVLTVAVLTVAALPAAAQVTAAPGSVDAALDAGGATSVALALHNAGSAPVEVRLVPRRAGSDGRGTLWAYDSHLFRIDPVTGEELARLPRPRATGGLREGIKRLRGTPSSTGPYELHMRVPPSQTNSGHLTSAGCRAPTPNLQGALPVAYGPPTEGDRDDERQCRGGSCGRWRTWGGRWRTPPPHTPARLLC